VFAGPGRPEQKQVVAWPANTDAELNGLERSVLADEFSMVFEICRALELEFRYVTVPEKSFG
jgi:hypothetical protein